MTSKYERLIPYLDAHEGASITLTFAEIETVVGPLPLGARSYPTWWAMTPKSRFLHAQVMAWWRAGYVVNRADVAAETVTFRRIPPS